MVLFGIHCEWKIYFFAGCMPRYFVLELPYPQWIWKLSSRLHPKRLSPLNFPACTLQLMQSKDQHHLEMQCFYILGLDFFRQQNDGFLFIFIICRKVFFYLSAMLPGKITFDLTAPFDRLRWVIEMSVSYSSKTTIVFENFVTYLTYVEAMESNVSILFQGNLCKREPRGHCTLVCCHSSFMWRRER